MSAERLCIECFRALEAYEHTLCEYCEEDEAELDPWRDWDEIVWDEETLDEEADDDS